MLIAGVLLALSYVLWFMFESIRFKAKSSKQTESLSSDKKTFNFYLAARLLTVYSTAIVPAVWKVTVIWMYIGIGLFIIGVLLRFVAMRTLGKYYSHWVVIKNDHKVVEEGPYKFVRHPSYLGMLLLNLGFVVFFFNIVSILLYCLFLVPMVVWRIIVEEKALNSLKSYESYSKKRKRLIPFIW